LLNELMLQKESSEKGNAHLLHELQAHQIELEMQNQKLREAQQALEETRDRYARLYDFAPVGYLTLDEKGNVLEINLTGATLLGLDRSEIIGRPLAARIASSETHAFFHHLSKTFKSPGNVVTELKLLGRDAEPCHVRLESASVLSETRVCLTVMTNITEQRRLASELQQTLTEQEALLATIPAIVFYMDMNLRYMTVSQVFAGFLGRPVEDVVGKSDFELFSHELAEEFQRINREVLRSGSLRSGLERQLADAHGNTAHLSMVLAPFYDNEGKIAGLVGVGLDVTQIKMAASINQELMQQNRMLTQNLFSVQESERRHLARELHDELGQWLTAIHAEAQAIESMLDREHKIEASVLAISNSASKMHTVIRDMLSQLRPALLDELGLADSLRELVDQWKKRHPGISSELVLEGNLSGFNENVNITVYRIVQEALSNASNYADADQVSVWVRHEAGATPDTDAVSLCVEDNGKGFDPEHASKGLGLLGMRERAIAAGGDFALRSAPGMGAHIEVHLPLNYKIERRRK
jgi:PAS domain S-box-containing protein